MDNLIESLFALIPIALILAIRLMTIRRAKVAKATKAESTKAPTIPIRKYNNRFYNDDELGIAPQGHWEEMKEQGTGIPDASDGTKVLVADFKSLSSQENGDLELVSSKNPRPPSSQLTKHSEPLKRLEALSPLKRAVVMAELLGPPKGMA